MEGLDYAASVAMAELWQTGEILVPEVEGRAAHDVKACEGVCERGLDGATSASGGR